MSDLSSLMNVAPLNASYMMGQNNAQDLQTKQQQMMELQQLMQQRQQQESRLQGREPLELEKMGLANQTSAAQLPGFAAQSRSLGVKANVDEGTQQSQIDSANFKSQNDMVMKVGGQLGSMAGDLEGVSDLEKPGIVKDAISQLGLPKPAAERLWSKLVNVPPAELAKKIQEISYNMLRANPEYAKDNDTAQLHTSAQIVTDAAKNASAERIAAGHDAATLAAATARASARHQSVEEGIANSKTALERYQKLNDAATQAELADEQEIARKYRERARNIEPQAIEELKRNAAAGSVSVGGVTGLPVNPSPSIAPPAQAAQPGAVAPASGAQAGRVSVIAPDGQRFTVPAHQLEQAIKKGYKKAP